MNGMYQSDSIPKYATLVCCCLIHLCVGMIYTWSSLTILVANIFSETIMHIGFGLTILMLGVFASLTSTQKFDPKYLILACALWPLKCVLLAISISQGSSLLLFLSCTMVGISTGILYPYCMNIGLKTFPKKEWLISGCVTTSFGLGSVFCAWWDSVTIHIYNFSIEQMILILGFLYTIIISLCVSVIRRYNEDNIEFKKVPEYVLNDTRFFLLRRCFLCSITAGICFIGLIGSIYEYMYDVYYQDIIFLLSLIGIVNGVSRIILSWLSNKIGRLFTITSFFYLEILIIALIITSADENIFILLTLLMVATYGGMFAILPGLIKDMFHDQFFEEIYGRVLLVWGFAGVLGPILAAIIQEFVHSYIYSLIPLAMILLVGLCDTIRLRGRFGC